ncbi:unnamed protein product [Chrysodeixis includens]|uniref:Uncharacterized protein n=1 Tax=Chrysodeixis includens TaxID=689277 RepID=A0A9N8L0D3_CHRIL|nr:unnamed protein product [Chrysodeixis includens]
MRYPGRAWVPLLVAAVIVRVQPQFVRQCGADDFRCSNNRCIESSRRCDSVYDCPDQEDERGCDCRPDEFRCQSDGYCIEERKRCDNVNHCADGSDEQDCVSRLVSWSGHHVCRDTGQFRCRDGTCISVLRRCDGFKDCKKDGSDEIGCQCNFKKHAAQTIGNAIMGAVSDAISVAMGGWIAPQIGLTKGIASVTSIALHVFPANGYYRCRSGKIIPDSLRCNRQYDCTPGDFSDEQNCRTVCMAYEYKCSSGVCVQADSRCNGTAECDDGSDETNCPCKRDQYPCRDGSCINIAYLCNGRADCSQGEDEYNCRSSCPPGRFTCSFGSQVACAEKCNGVSECDGGEDEDDCGACAHKCDGTCISTSQICDRNEDCSDGSDENDCNFCDRPDDFRCESGECLSYSLLCNGISECSDASDEQNCNRTMTTNPEQPCSYQQFQCISDHVCIDQNFFCDGHRDCNDGSDEANCRKYSNKWTLVD